MSMKNTNDTNENRTCDRPAFSAEPQPTAPLRVPFGNILKQNYGIRLYRTYKCKFRLLEINQTALKTFILSAVSTFLEIFWHT
jgi:hypothetical protein